MHEIELLDILKAICDVRGDPHIGRKSESQATQLQPANGLSFKAQSNRSTDNTDVIDGNSIMPDYFRSSINKAADGRANPVFTNKIHKELGDFFFRKYGVLMACLVCRSWRAASGTRHPQESSIFTQAPEGGAIKTNKKAHGLKAQPLKDNTHTNKCKHPSTHSKF